jgi:hypothetical protein
MQQFSMKQHAFSFLFTMMAVGHASAMNLPADPIEALMAEEEG